MIIEVNNEKCTRCGKCIKVCPSSIFIRKDDKTVTTVNVENCIECGHCAAVCADDAVIHSLFPAEKVHKIDYATMPTPEQMMLLMKARRSNRSFTGKPVPAEALEMILEAGHRAPTASNEQNVHFTVVTDPDKLALVTDFTFNVFGAMIKKLTNPIIKPLAKAIVGSAFRYVPLFKHMENEYAKGNNMILRNANTLIIIHTPKSSRYGTADSNLAYQNASLMAESLGISQCYMGFVCNAVGQKSGKLEQALGIDGKIHAIMAIGVPAFRYANYIDREDIVVDSL